MKKTRDLQPHSSRSIDTWRMLAPITPELSGHGRRRLQQRGISLDQVVAVLEYGCEQRAHGASRYFLDRCSRERLAREMPNVLRDPRGLDIHVVLSDEGTLITAAHRIKRIRRDIQHHGRRAQSERLIPHAP